jgi:hypothetical protein
MIELTPRAIDQASNRVQLIWIATRNKGINGDENEGFYSWLKRIAGEAVDSGEILPSGKIRYRDIKFGLITASIFDSNCYTLQSVERCS